MCRLKLKKHVVCLNNTLSAHKHIHLLPPLYLQSQGIHEPNLTKTKTVGR